MYTCPETDIYPRLTHGLAEATHGTEGGCTHTHPLPRAVEERC